MGTGWLKKRLELEKLMGVDALFRKPGVSAELRKLEEEVRNCTRCRLHEGRTQGVFACGSPHAALMFIGEAPGRDEDAQGIPFVGRAGKLLDQMILAMGLQREEVYITNIIKSRPPNNREPRADEVEACFPYLERQIELIQPQIICTLGRPATNALLSTNRSMGEMRGKWHFYRGIAVLPTYHSAYLLRSPGQKGKAWQDLKKLIVALAEGPPQAPGLF
ncbi:MAG: uracil-DNA glycosylase [Candidatus Brocadiae bacterium]|nr:uracil-DNA glycosylase [Candidatus Brocadiia bacterium]